MIRRGTRVRLKRSVARKKSRMDTATVLNRYPNYIDQKPGKWDCVCLDSYLEGYRYWNVQDLERVHRDR